MKGGGSRGWVASGGGTDKEVCFEELVEIQQYNFQVIHKPGCSNINVDALSHSTHLPDASQEEEEQRLSAVTPQEFTKERVLQAQQEDPDLVLVTQWVKTGKVLSKEEIQGKEKNSHGGER